MVTAEQRAIAAAARAAEAPHAVDPASAQDEGLARAQAWAALATIPDPEIPAISIVELGIVRDVRVEDGVLAVDITPTYSGCPATDVILHSITAALSDAGYPDARVVSKLSPPWTTDWIAPEGRRRLSAYGIAPPGAAAARIDVSGISPLRRATVAVACPRCASTRTRLLAQFGSTACKALYRCDACLEPFDYFKPH